MARHVSAQLLDFLDIDEISSFLNWKQLYVSILGKATLWMVTSSIPTVAWMQRLGSRGGIGYCFRRDWNMAKVRWYVKG